jgi:hypothetical protein
VIRQVALIEVGKGDAAQLERALRDAAPKLAGLQRSQLGRHLAGTVGGGDFTWDAWLDDAAPPLADWLAAHPLGGVRVFPGTREDALAQFDADMCRMSDHIRVIRNWAYARTDPALHPTHWTHVWEQEYAELEGLKGDYMLHAYHWGWIDRYFDLESGLRIVDPRIAHVFYRAEGDGTILTAS